MYRELRLLAFVAVIFFVAASAHAYFRHAKTTEFLATTAGFTTCPASQQSQRKSIEFSNHGPNKIFVRINGDTSVGREIAADSSWALDASEDVVFECKAATANQLTGDGTIITEGW